MSDKDVKLEERVETCDGATKKYIEAVPPNIVLVNKNFKVKYESKLGADAHVRFFDISEKGDTSKVIDGFCDEMNGGEFLLVKAGKKENCKSNVDGHFAYTVKATGYEPLDPVLIIEPLVASPGFLFSLTPLLASAAVGGVAVLGVQRFLARRKSKKEAA